MGLYVRGKGLASFRILLTAVMKKYSDLKDLKVHIDNVSDS